LNETKNAKPNLKYDAGADKEFARKSSRKNKNVPRAKDKQIKPSTSDTSRAPRG
jgi:hypothetical protein